MKTIQKERVTKEYYNIYIASDGTEFRDEEECKKYEQSAKGVLMAKYRDLVVKESDEESILGYGCCDNKIEVVSVRTEAEYDIVLQLKLLTDPWLMNEGQEISLDICKKKIRRALDEKDVLLINGSYDGDAFWIMGTRNSLKESLDKFCAPEKKDGDA